MSNLYIRKFIERLEHLEARGQKDFNCSIQDARRLRSELTTLLLDLEELRRTAPLNEIIHVDIAGSSF
jgi:hypothetical protein